MIINIQVLPIFSNNKLSDFDKWLEIRQEFTIKITIKIKNVINHGIFKMNQERILLQPEQVNPITSKSTLKYDHSRREKFEFPDLPPESDNKDFNSNKKENLVSDKRKVSDTSFLDSQTDKKKIGFENQCSK